MTRPADSHTNALVLVEDGNARVVVGDVLIVDLDLIAHGGYSTTDLIVILRNLVRCFPGNADVGVWIEIILRQIEYRIPDEE